MANNGAVGFIPIYDLSDNLHRRTVQTKGHIPFEVVQIIIMGRNDDLGSCLGGDQAAIVLIHLQLDGNIIVRCHSSASAVA